MKTLILGVLASAALSATVYFTPKELTELKALPSSLSETVLLIKKGAVLTVKSTVCDSAGKEWYMVRGREGGATGFVPAASLEVLGDEKEEETTLGNTTAQNEEKKRRMNEVMQHGDWAMRIKRSVRNGAICLKMTEDQLVASWQSPYQRTSGFILGSGEVQIFFYRESNPIAVVMKNGEVIGWSERE